MALYLQDAETVALEPNYYKDPVRDRLVARRRTTEISIEKNIYINKQELAFARHQSL